MSNIKFPSRLNVIKNFYLNGFGEGAIVINRITVTLNGDLLFDPGLHKPVVFFLVLCQK